jgi:hypothetical protein
MKPNARSYCNPASDHKTVTKQGENQQVSGMFKRDQEYPEKSEKRTSSKDNLITPDSTLSLPYTFRHGLLIRWFWVRFPEGALRKPWLDGIFMRSVELVVAIFWLAITQRSQMLFFAASGWFGWGVLMCGRVGRRGGRVE